MLAHPVVAAVSDRRRRSEIEATIYVLPYNLRDRTGAGRYRSKCILPGSRWPAAVARISHHDFGRAGLSRLRKNPS